MNKTTNQNVETSNGKTGSEYVLVNGQDLFDVDYDEGVAKLREDVTLEDLEVNNHEYTDLGEFGLREYFESNDFQVDEERTTDDEQVFFTKVEQ